jgi:hypothetical protein
MYAALIELLFHQELLGKNIYLFISIKLQLLHSQLDILKTKPGINN